MQQQTPRSPGYIYIMQVHPGYATWDGTIYKIGLSIHPDQRQQELDRNLAPFARVRYINSYGVANMYDVEQKLHVLFDDKCIGGEYFNLEDHDLDAFFKLVEQVDKVVNPPSKRRATSYYKYDAPTIESEDSDISLPTELESLILAYIRHSRNRLSLKMREYLHAPVVARGYTYDSPEGMWHDATFRQWADMRLSWLSQQPHCKVEQAVHMIRNYGVEKYGWLDYKREVDRIQTHPFNHLTGQVIEKDMDLE